MDVQGKKIIHHTLKAEVMQEKRVTGKTRPVSFMEKEKKREGPRTSTAAKKKKNKNAQKNNKTKQSSTLEL